MLEMSCMEARVGRIDTCVYIVLYCVEIYELMLVSII